MWGGTHVHEHTCSNPTHRPCSPDPRRRQSVTHFPPQIQIGCQTDRLTEGVLKRAPCVHEHFPVTSEMMQVWNLWGGLMYLVVPPNTKVEGLEVIVQMAVPAPYYKSGESVVGDTGIRLRMCKSSWGVNGRRVGIMVNNAGTSELYSVYQVSIELRNFSGF